MILSFIIMYFCRIRSNQIKCSTLLSDISLFLFLFFFHFSHGILLLFHIRPYHLSNPLQPLSIFLFLLHIKFIQITHASLFILVHTYIYHNHTSMSSFHSFLQANILPSPSVSLLPPHLHLQNIHFWDILCVAT